MHEPLKNCPFCGCAPTIVERPDNIDGTQFFYAIACYCGHHSACAHKMAVRKTPEIAKADAIAAWNTRTQQPTQAQAGAVPLPKFMALKFHARRDKKATVTLLFPDHEAADAWVRGIKGGQHG